MEETDEEKKQKQDKIKARKLLIDSQVYGDNKKHDEAIKTALDALSIAEKVMEQNNIELEAFIYNVGSQYIFRATNTNVEYVKTDTVNAKPYLFRSFRIRLLNLGRDHKETLAVEKIIKDIYGEDGLRELYDSF